MGHRLSKITTRTGDAGETGLGDGSRVPKDSPRVRALGDIDELNSAIGVLLAEELPPELRDAPGAATCSGATSATNPHGDEDPWQTSASTTSTPSASRSASTRT